MHDNEAVADEMVVARLLAHQFPQWASFKLTRMSSMGTDNTIFRLGDEMALRFPRIGSAADQIVKESVWLPRFASLPLPVPRVLARGEPGGGFPWPWLVMNWIAGETLADELVADWDQAAAQLGGFIVALQAIDATGGPAAGEANHGRGVPLVARDWRTRAAIASLAGDYEQGELTAVWERALMAPPHAGKPVWVHGDLNVGNLIVRRGRLAGVIDFGLMGVGDPAVDLMPAWSVLPVAAREAFRQASGADPAAWSRGKGWALSTAVVALDYYRHTNPALAGVCRKTLSAVLGDASG